MYGKKEINKAPFTVNIAPEATGPLALVRAFGPGLEGGVVGKPCNFTVETNGAVGALGKRLVPLCVVHSLCVSGMSGSTKELLCQALMPVHQMRTPLQQPVCHFYCYSLS